jgi:hypothetical protein
MSPLGTISGSWQNAPIQAFSRLRIAQKPNVHSGLHDDNQAETKPRHGSNGSQSASTLPRSGTETTVPFQHAPRLVSPFVAQLLGQIMPDPESAISRARAAYGLNSECSSLLFDARL